MQQQRGPSNSIERPRDTLGPSQRYKAAKHTIKYIRHKLMQIKQSLMFFIIRSVWQIYEGLIFRYLMKDQLNRKC